MARARNALGAMMALVFAAVLGLFGLGVGAASAADEYAVELRVSCLENLAFSKYDITVLVDDEVLGSIDHGGSATYDLTLSGGSHKLVVQKRGDDSIDGSKTFTIKEDSRVSCSVECKKSQVAIDGLTVSPASAPSDETQGSGSGLVQAALSAAEQVVGDTLEQVTGDTVGQVVDKVVEKVAPASQASDAQAPSSAKTDPAKVAQSKVAEDGTIVVEMPASEDPDAVTHVVRLGLTCVENKMLSRYDLRVLLDDVEIGTLAHGKAATYELKLAEGKHELRVEKKDDAKTKGATTFEVADRDTAPTFELSCSMSEVAVKALNLSAGSKDIQAAVENLAGAVAWASAESPDFYMEDGWDAFVAATGAAAAVLENPDATASDIKAASDTLGAAIGALKPALWLYAWGSYEDLMRYPDAHVGERLVFSGEVAQVMDSGSTKQLRVYVGGDWDFDSVIYAVFDSSLLDFNILEDDYVTVYGTFVKLYSYTALLGNKITVPLIQVDQLFLN